MSTHEQSHIKNVNNLEQLLVVLVLLGDAYQPSNDEISIVKLQDLHQQSKSAMQNIIEMLTNYTYAVDKRQLLFEGLKPYCTKIVNVLFASGASEKTMEDVKSVNRKVSGASKKKTNKTAQTDAANITDTATTDTSTTDATNTTETTNNTTLPTTKSISRSQQSYDQLTERFALLISLAIAEPKYQPNEEQLSHIGLNMYLEELKTANTNVKNTIVPLQNARTKRNVLLYTAETGLYDQVLKVKNYIKAIFGYKSAEYKQVSAIKFKKLARKK